MTALSKKEQSESFYAFQESIKGAYTHGLEHIYAIETVDLKTVRLIKTEKSREIKQVAVRIDGRQPWQSELRLKDRFCSTMPSFILKEPVSVLELSLYAFKRLCKDRMVYLKELIDSPQILEGMGQGHIDEIQQKLNQYLAGKIIYGCDFISYEAWLRGLIAELDRKKAALFLEQYHLNDIVSLSRAEQIALGQLSLENRQQACQEISVILQKNKNDFLKDLHQVVEVFIVPWVRGRLGLVTGLELAERIERIAEKPDSAALTWQLFETVYFDDKSIWSQILLPLDESLFCVDAFVQEAYTTLVKEVLSYFYRPDLTYPLQQLLTWIESSFASRWIGFPEGFAEKVVRFSPYFRVRKGEEGLIVKLA